MSRRCFPKQNTRAEPKSHMQFKSQASVNSWGPAFSALLLDKGLGYLGDPALLQRLWETGPQGLSSLNVLEQTSQGWCAELQPWCPMNCAWLGGFLLQDAMCVHVTADLLESFC